MTREDCKAAILRLLGVPANEVECVEVSDPYADSYERPKCVCRMMQDGRMKALTSARDWAGLVEAVRETRKAVACGGG